MQVGSAKFNVSSLLLKKSRALANNSRTRGHGCGGGLRHCRFFSVEGWSKLMYDFSAAMVDPG
jgi:hypothetical protein